MLTSHRMNALRVGSSNLSCALKPCACADTGIPGRDLFFSCGQ